MPLSPPVERELFHQRSIECHGYRRKDGLWDIEARIVDRKNHPFPNIHRGFIPVGDALHDMSLRITLDDTLTIQHIEAVTDASPFALCPEITSAFQQLVGLTIQNGWTQIVKERLGGIKGCTHLVELLSPLATTAFQTIFGARLQQSEGRVDPTLTTKPIILDTCHALASDSPVVKIIYPQFYTGKSAA